ncbi:MAG TPA: hypothetical protein VGA04_19130 [Streptosporangiaceae bacterium]
MSADRDQLRQTFTFSHHETEVAYSAAAWMDTLRTCSSTIAMESGAREGLLSCLARFIDSRYGGRITKRYLFGLCVARLRPASH